MKRFGQVIKVKPECVEDYIYAHAHPWPEINAMLKECNIQHYSIFYRDGYLFAFFEYVGNDYEADMQKMADDPMTQKWWDKVKPYQDPLDTIQADEWWANMEEVFYLD